MRAQEVRGLMEAYSQVHEPITEEQVWEEWLEKLEEQEVLSEIGGIGGQKALDKVRSDMAAERQSASRLDDARARRFPGAYRTAGPAKPPMPGLPPSAKKVTQYPQGVSTGVGGGNAGASRATPAAKPAATPAAKPAATPAAKPATTSAAPKPTTPAAPAKPAGSAMGQWAAANPKLAAASAERDRTRGTSATTNPLMKDMKSSLPAPKSPAPSTAKTGFDLAKKGVNLAASVDIFDLVKGHLLDEGYADSEEGAMVIMTNMSEQWRKSILEAHGVEILDEISKELATKAFANRATRAKVTKEDLQAWVGQLIAEGYDLSEYTWEEVAEMYFEELELAEAQSARENPEKYERSSEAKEGRRKRSGMNDPDTGINSDKFKAFMAQQMGGKKKKD